MLIGWMPIVSSYSLMSVYSKSAPVASGSLRYSHLLPVQADISSYLAPQGPPGGPSGPGPPHGTPDLLKLSLMPVGSSLRFELHEIR